VIARVGRDEPTNRPSGNFHACTEGEAISKIDCMAGAKEFDGEDPARDDLLDAAHPERGHGGVILDAAGDRQMVKRRRIRKEADLCIERGRCLLEDSEPDRFAGLSR
jgi:hypothetical protein